MPQFLSLELPSAHLLPPAATCRFPCARFRALVFPEGAESANGRQYSRPAKLWPPLPPHLSFQRWKRGCCLPPTRAALVCRLSCERMIIRCNLLERVRGGRADLQRRRAGRYSGRRKPGRSPATRRTRAISWNESEEGERACGSS